MRRRVILLALAAVACAGAHQQAVSRGVQLHRSSTGDSGARRPNITRVSGRQRSEPPACDHDPGDEDEPAAARSRRKLLAVPFNSDNNARHARRRAPKYVFFPSLERDGLRLRPVERVDVSSAAPNTLTVTGVLTGPGTARFVINKSELGNTRVFSFRCAGVPGRQRGQHHPLADNAPASGVYTSRVATPTSAAPAAGPASPPAAPAASDGRARQDRR
jgi:hypothetical protein